MANEEIIINNIDNQLHEVAMRLGAVESSFKHLTENLEKGFKTLSEQMELTVSSQKNLEARLVPLEQAHNKRERRWSIASKFLLTTIMGVAGVLGAKFGGTIIAFAHNLFN